MPISQPHDQSDGLIASRPHDGPWRVLLVENHADTRQSVRIFLRSLGYQVTEAADVAEARARAEQCVFDVLLSDLTLPDGDGRELLVQLGRERHCPRHAIAMSGLSSADEQRRSREAGFTWHLVKPFTPEELQETLEQVVSASWTPGVGEEIRAAVPRSPEPGDNARLAQRMHDDLCQQLAAAAMWQGMLIRQLENVAPPLCLPEKAVEEARQVSRLLDGALTEARALMRLLRGDEGQL